MKIHRREFLAGLIGLAASVSHLQAAESRSKTGLLMHKGFARHHISPVHPESPARYAAIEQALADWPRAQQLVRLSPLSLSETEPWLHHIHSEAHIEAIRTQPETFEDVLLATAAVLSAVDGVMQGTVRNAFCASRPPGHHALNTGQEEGFCYFNHIAIAARYAQHKYQVKKVLIIDWDYHHGNGTEWAFYDDPSVLFFSTHDQFAYPGTGSPLRRGKGAGEGFNINVHLDCGTDDKTILNAFETHLRPAADAFKPELILISAGFDSRQDDLLGCFTVTDDGFYALTRWVMALAVEYCDGKLVSLLEGGYNIKGNASAIISHLAALEHS
jgi:acetoin utilization deacetylase AcuC-like enzyme